MSLAKSLGLQPTSKPRTSWAMPALLMRSRIAGALHDVVAPKATCLAQVLPQDIQESEAEVEERDLRDL